MIQTLVDFIMSNMSWYAVVLKNFQVESKDSLYFSDLCHHFGGVTLSKRLLLSFMTDVCNVYVLKQMNKV